MHNVSFNTRAQCSVAPDSDMTRDNFVVVVQYKPGDNIDYLLHFEPVLLRSSSAAHGALRGSCI